MKNLFIFVVGAAIGSAVTWFAVKDVYAKLAQEEIDSVKERFGNRKEDISMEAEKQAYKEVYKELADSYKTNDYSASDKPSSKTTKKEDKPYVIAPDEFGEIDEYDTITLIHYSDGILTDDDDVKLENLEETVMADYADHFGEYEDDSVFVRNDRLKADYEILYDHRKYSDIVLTKPYNMRD